jgi:AcrR family transcriptional regulator
MLEDEQEPPGQVADGLPGRRRYDSPVRRERAARTRQRIVDAGADLVRELPAWDWRGLTFAAVAARAPVGVRTVYRHFPTERALHDAILARLQEQAGGVTYEGLALDDVARVTARVHASLASFAVSRWTDEVPSQPALAEVDLRRRAALAAAVAEATRGWPPAEQEMAAGILDVLWNLPSYERLRTAWNLEGAQATSAIMWAIDIITSAIRSGRRPGG